MNFKKFNDIGDSEPKAWKRGVGTKFETDDFEDDEIPVPYCDESDEETEDDDEYEDLEVDTETETESVTSITKKIKFFSSNVLHEENDFKPE
jgi:hypothetical protein